MGNISVEFVKEYQKLQENRPLANRFSPLILTEKVFINTRGKVEGKQAKTRHERPL